MHCAAPSRRRTAATAAAAQFQFPSLSLSLSVGTCERKSNLVGRQAQRKINTLRLACREEEEREVPPSEFALSRRENNILCAHEMHGNYRHLSAAAAADQSGAASQQQPVKTVGGQDQQRLVARSDFNGLPVSCSAKGNNGDNCSQPASSARQHFCNSPSKLYAASQQAIGLPVSHQQSRNNCQDQVGGVSRRGANQSLAANLYGSAASD